MTYLEKLYSIGFSEGVRYFSEKKDEENNTLRNALIGTTLAGAGTGITGHLLARKKLNDLADMSGGVAWDNETKKSRKKLKKAIDETLSASGAKDIHSASAAKALGEHLDLVDKKLGSMSEGEAERVGEKIKDFRERQKSLVKKYGEKDGEKFAKNYRANKLMRNIGYGVAGAGLLGTGAYYLNKRNKND